MMRKKIPQILNKQNKKAIQSIARQPLRSIDKVQKRCNCNHGRWNFQQNNKYFDFLIENKSQFDNKKSRKIWKIFKMMSEFVGTRDTYQSRSHHQKMLVKYGSIQNIITKMAVFRSVEKIEQQSEDRNQDLLNYETIKDNQRKPDQHKTLINQFDAQNNASQNQFLSLSFTNFGALLPMQSYFFQYLSYYPNYPKVQQSNFLFQQ